MTLKEVTETFYSIYLYKTEGYDCFKYDYKLPSTYYKTIQTFFERNKFVIQELARYPKTVVVFKSIISIFIYNKGRSVGLITNKDYEKFKDSIFYYKNEFDLFISKFSEYQINSYIDIYNMYVQRKINFFIFYYFLKYIRFQESFVNKELIRNKFIEVHKLMKFFKHFNEDEIKEKLSSVQKIIILNEM